MRPVPKILSDITKTVSASGAQFLITLVTTPLMTRLYPPEAYAMFGIIFSMATVTIGVGFLSLSNVYPLEKDAERQADVMRAMLRLWVILVVLAVITAALMPYIHWLEADGFTLALLPVLVLTLGLRQMLVSVATSRTQFGAIALGQLVEPVCSRGGSITCGAVGGGNPAFILASVAVGHLATSITLARRLCRHARPSLRPLLTAPVTLAATLRRYPDFAVYNTLSQQAMPLTLLAIQMALVAFFSDHMAGQYMLAVSILSLPVGLIAMASGSVLYRHFIQINREQPALLGQYVLQATILYLAAGFGIFSPVLLFGEEIFPLVFGEAWKESGNIASILSIAYAVLFGLTAVQSIFRITRHLRLQFWMEVVMGIMVLTGTIVCSVLFDLRYVICGLATLWIIRNTVMLCACVRVASRHSAATIQAVP